MPSDLIFFDNELVEAEFDDLNTANYEPFFEIITEDNMEDVIEFYVKRFEEYLEENPQVLSVIGRNESSLFYFFKMCAQTLMILSIKQ